MLLGPFLETVSTSRYDVHEAAAPNLYMVKVSFLHSITGNEFTIHTGERLCSTPTGVATIFSGVR